MTKQTEALKLALEALENAEDQLAKPYSTGARYAITAIREALAERCVCGEPDTPGTHRTDGPCLAEQPAQQEPVAWRNAAIRIGEDLSSVGPDGYYDMTASQWLDWAMAQEPRGKTSPPAQRTWVGLTDEDFNSDMFSITSLGVCDIATIKSIAKDVEAKLREKNT